MPSSSYVHASDPTAPSGDISLSSEGIIDMILTKDDVDKFVAKMNNQAIFLILDPPGPCPTCTGTLSGKKADTKTRATADLAAAKKEKARAKAERKLGMATRKAKAQVKKREKLEAQARKADGRAESLCIELAEATSPGVASTVPKKGSATKKSKGAGGQVTVSSLSPLTTQSSPQYKITGYKKWVMVGSPCWPDTISSSSSSGSESGSEDAFTSGEPLLLRSPAVLGQYGQSSAKGGHRYGSPA